MANEAGEALNHPPGSAQETSELRAFAEVTSKKTIIGMLLGRQKALGCVV